VGVKTLLEFQDVNGVTPIVITTEGLWVSALLDEWAFKVQPMKSGAEACIAFLSAIIAMGLKAEVDHPEVAPLLRDERIRVQVQSNGGLMVLTEQQEH
jgi:hypothetical protein